MVKNPKITIEKLAQMMAKGFSNTATKNDLTDIRAKMATKNDLADTERRLSNKIDAVAETIQQLEEIDVRGLQYRVSALEKNVKQIKHKHV